MYYGDDIGYPLTCGDRYYGGMYGDMMYGGYRDYYPYGMGRYGGGYGMMGGGYG